jgi:hypothetical protein
MTPPIQLTGGTGTIGGRVVRRLREAGRAARVLGRRGHTSGDGIGYVTGELAAGEGIEAAVDGAGAIAHRAGGANCEEDETGDLPRAASRAEHVAYVSVVGADRVPVVNRVGRAVFGSFGSRLALEQAVGHRSREEFLAERVGGPARQAGDAVGTAASADVGSTATTPRRERRKPHGATHGATHGTD